MKIFLIIFGLVWAWIIYELYNAPLYDEDENPIE